MNAVRAGRRAHETVAPLEMSEQMMSLHKLTLFVALCTLAGCAGGDMGGSSPSSSAPSVHPSAQALPAGAEQQPSSMYPAGVIAFDPKRNVSGIYPASPAAADTCCWAGPDVRFELRAAARATHLRLTVYELRLASVGGQTVTLLDGSRPAASHHVVPGLQTLVLPLPAGAVRGGVARVHLRMSASFVPKNEGMNGDERHLTLVIRDVRTQ